jgi:hypothetical protein
MFINNTIPGFVEAAFFAVIQSKKHLPDCGPAGVYI